MCDYRWKGSDQCLKSELHALDRCPGPHKSRVAIPHTPHRVFSALRAQRARKTLRGGSRRGWKSRGDKQTTSPHPSLLALKLLCCFIEVGSLTARKDVVVQQNQKNKVHVQRGAHLSPFEYVGKHAGRELVKYLLSVPS